MNAERSQERGSALIIALLVTVVLALLGISFLLMAETENRIARNERRSAQALYAAQSTVRVVKSWFDAPTTAMLVPGPGQIDRTQRSIVAAADPYDPTDETAADGVIGSQPYYKQQIDLDGNGRDDLFDRPYRDDSRHSFLGSESGPDLVLDNADADAATYFRALELQMFDGYPGNGLVVRLERIDLLLEPFDILCPRLRNLALRPPLRVRRSQIRTEIE